MLRKTLFLIAFCMALLPLYAQTSSPVGNTAYAISRTSGAYGISSFALDEFSSFLMRFPNNDDVRSATFVEGSMYGLLYVDGAASEIVSYSLSDGTRSSVVATTGNFIDMAYDYSNGTILLIQYEYPSSMLVRLNLQTKEFTTLCTFDYSMFSVAVDLDGTIYTADMSGDIYRLDGETYELNTVVSTGHYATSSALRSLDFDHKTGKLYFLACGSWAGTYLFEIDLEAATSTSIGGMASNSYVGLFTGYTTAAPESPAAPIGLAMEPAADGGNQCELTWTNPSTSFNRGNIGTLTKATIYRNGEVVGSVDDVQAGQPASYTDNLPASANCQYFVTLSNEAGEGMFAKISGYVGKDVPAAPTDVVATSSTEDNTITITWTAPTTGLNDGPFTTDGLSYKVVRSDDKVIVESTTETSATDVIDTQWTGYTYTVIAKNNAGEGGSAVSNAAAAGLAWSLPVVSSLSDEESFNCWTVVDANGDGNTWHLGNLWTYGSSPLGAEFRRDPVNTGEGDEWLISPPATLEAGQQSSITFDVNTSYSPTENIEVYFAPAGTPIEEAELVESLSIRGSSGYYGYSATVAFDAVEEAGDYRVYLRYAVAQGSSYPSHEGMRITNFEWADNNRGTVRGHVYVEGMTFYGVTVTMGEYSTKTDYSGAYEFVNVRTGEYDVTASYIVGYATDTKHITLNPQEELTVDLNLTRMQEYAVKGKIVDSNDNPIRGARVSVTGYTEGSAVTDAEGLYEMPLYDGDYHVIVEKNHYVMQESDFQIAGAIKEDLNFSLELDALPAYEVSATATSNGADVVWEAPLPLKELSYDNGVQDGGYGYGSYGSETHIVGVIYPGSNTLYELKWMTAEGDGSENNINLLVLGINYGGEPTGEVLFEAANVPTEHGVWNTYRLPEPIYSDQGFLFAISGKTHVATDAGSEDGEVDHPFTQVFTTNYEFPSGYQYMDETSDPSRHFLMRLSCQAEEVADATVPEYNYDLYRLPESARNSESQWTLIDNFNSGDELTYSDTNVPSGEYLYAVRVNYPSFEMESEAVFSEVVEINMIADVTVNVSANSAPEHANGANVTLYNNVNNYTATVVDGKATFNQVEKGTYSITIRKNGFEEIGEEDLNITGEDVAFSFDYTLTQRLDRPVNIDVFVDGTSARLMWNMQPNIFDNFDGDDYVDFEVNPAGNVGWQYIDGDGMTTWNFSYTTFPHMTEPMAAITFNSETTTPPLGVSTSYSGTRALAFVAARGINDAVVESDDYMFSPELKPYRDFKFSFYAMTYEELEGYRERIKVGYSTTTPEVDQITWLDEDYNYVPLEYTKYEYTIPAEAKYVVLHSASLSNFLLFVDDVFIGVEDQIIGNEYMPVNVEGYEVYLDDAKIAEIAETEYTFTGLESGAHTAAVVQKFATGNSEPLSITFTTTSGVDGTMFVDFSIYAAGETLYINGDYSTALVYNAAGMQVMSLTGEHKTDISALARGLYVVKAVKANGEVVTAKIMR